MNILAETQTERYGFDATGITLSRNQLEHVRGEIARRGLGGRVRAELTDYRDLPGDARYDKIARVGMFEHVGVARLPAYFAKLRDALRPGGFVLNHGITHNGLHGESLGSGIGEFVEDYVFPGGELTHVSTVMRAMAQAGLEAFDAQALREHYAKTLWHWTERLEANAAAARAEVGEERYRVWRIYMAGSQMPGMAVRGSLPVMVGNVQVGYASTSTWSPLLKKYIALAHLQKPYFEVGTNVRMAITVEHHRQHAPAKVVRLPFYEPEWKKK